MIRSIRQFLLITLLISITIASSITAVGNYLLDKQVIQPYLDEQLTKIYSFIVLIDKKPQTDKKTTVYLNEKHSKSHIFFQVWNPNGKLILDSPTNITQSLQDAPIGFSDKQLNGSAWRIYADYNPNTKDKIVVAELYEIRNQLADDITE